MARRRGRTTTRRVRVLKPAPERFFAGHRLHADGLEHVEIELDTLPQQAPDVVVDVIRPLDLVALTFEAYGCELVVDNDGPALRPRSGAGADARLVVRLPYQHLAEEAIFEGVAPIPKEMSPDGEPTKPSMAEAMEADDNARPRPPVGARPARGSRLVFALADDERIEFSTEGLLAALARLRLLVHPLALPGDAPRPKAPGPGFTLVLPGGLMGTVTEAGILLDRAPRRLVPNTKTTEGLVTVARDLRRMRTILTRESAVPAGARVAGEVVEVFGPDEVIPTLTPRPTRFNRPRLSRPPQPLETAVEAPFRLIVSPSEEAAWAHATTPVRDADAPHRVELWHTRLAWRKEKSDGTFEVDERTATRRTIRAVWARDRDTMPGWKTAKVVAHDNDDPFRTSLDGSDRHMLVRQSAETWLGKGDVPIAPVPVAARGLWLSSLGAWLDFHGQWTTLPYSADQMASILTWDHIAPLGRDEYVRVVYPGYLYPFGHQAALVKVTERKMKDASPSLAGLYQRKFLVIGDPIRRYDYDGHRDLPFTEVRIRPLVTPNLEEPTDPNNVFWPIVDGGRFPFVLDTVDHEGRPVRLVTPLMWVPEHKSSDDDLNAIDAAYAGDGDRHVKAHGQRIAFTPVKKGGDTVAEVDTLSFLGEARRGGSQPKLERAKALLPAVQNVSPVGPLGIKYAEVYTSGGFGGAANAGEVWADVLPDQNGDVVQMKFGDQGASSDKAGGFLQPNLPIRGLSRLAGVVGDPAGVAGNKFDPAAFLAGALPKLFGLVPLDELVQGLADLTGAPNLVSETLDRVEAFLADLERAKATVQEAVAEAERVKALAEAQDKAASVVNDAKQVVADVKALRQKVVDAVDDFVAAMETVVADSQADLAAALSGSLTALRNAATSMESIASKLPPLVAGRLQTLARVLRDVVEAADVIDDLFRFLNGLDPSSIQTQFRYEWRPTLASWPSPANPFLGIAEPILQVKPDSMVLSVEGRANGKGEVGVEVLAELRDFTLHLLPGTPLVRIPFDHMSFKAGSAGKPEVDVVLGEIEFLGLLGFVETLKDMIPFDGFSDPPYLDVTPEGLTAGFSLALPSVAIGVFTLSNISLSADVEVPFLGKAVTVGFGFCSRERPFTLAVAFLGGGGWFLLRLSPDGLDVLEVGLEAGATLSVDFGVASGSISAMIGIYIRLEGNDGSLTAYFRLRGEVDVLGLISASIELYLALTYDFDTGKLVGRARITVEVDVLVFSGSVSIECERRFAGSNGDPTLEQVLAVEADGTSGPWSAYCSAFAGE